MPHPPSTPAIKPNSPEETASPERHTTPQASRQHLFQPQNHLPHNDTSGTAKVEQGEVDTSDTEAPQNSRHTSPDENGRPRNPTPESQGQRPYQHHPRGDTSGTGGEGAEGEGGENDAAEGEEGDSDISDMELGQEDGGRR